MKREQLNYRLLKYFVIATLVGTGMHFLYDFLPNPLTGILGPLNESVWEHMKLIFWPYLAAALIWTRKDREELPSWLISLFVICVLLLVIGWVYYFPLAQPSRAWFNIGLYVLLMALGFYLPTILSLSDEIAAWGIRLVAVLGVLIVVFSFWQPDWDIFVDLSMVSTWYGLNC